MTGRGLTLLLLLFPGALGAAWISAPTGTDSFAFEKRFALTNAAAAATLRISAPGFYEASLDGARIGDRVLDPAPTDYTKRVYFAEYPLALGTGEHVLKVLLGHGWYDQRGLAGWSNHQDRWRDRPCLWAELEIRYRDGTKETLSTDASWRTAANPVLWDDFREGEIIDPGWVRPRTGAGAPATVVAGPAGALQAADFPPARIVKEFPPVKCWPVKAGGWMLDFGVDLAGWTRMKFKGAARGDVVTVRYDERIAPDGEPAVRVLRKDVKKIGRNELWPENARTIDAHFHAVASTNVLAGGAFQQDRFICSGAAEETYEPRFTYKGFRYVWVQGVGECPEAVACEIRTDFAETGSFACSDEDFNALMRMADRAYRSNFTDGVPTDCPHREKNGWTGDAGIACEFAQYAYENTDAYVKWIRDLVDAQRADGNLPGIVPSGGWGWFDRPDGKSSGGPGAVWGSAVGFIPWNLLVYRDDPRGIRTAYPALKRFLEFETSQRRADGMIPNGLADWIPMDEADYVDHDFCGTAYYHGLLQIARQSALVLGKAEEAEDFARRAAETKRQFNAVFARGDGVYGRGSQTEQSVALNFGLVPAAERPLAERRLVAAVHERGDRFHGGLVASKHVFRALSRAGETALAFRMLKAPGEPGFMHWKEAGGTALWEDWWGGFSRNHVMFADFAAWAYQYLAGIRLPEDGDSTAAVPVPPARGFERVIVAPDFIDELDFVTASVRTKQGKLVSGWRRTGGEIELKVVLPEGVRATVRLPRKDSRGLTEHELCRQGEYSFRLPAASGFELADPFWGSGAVASPESTGPARGWNWEKAQTGNTHPGAVRPFGWVSCCAYTGGYSSGYGRQGCSSSGPAPFVKAANTAFGFAHFHMSGTGWINKFYNYVLFTPYAVSADGARTLPKGSDPTGASKLTEEVAHPGYYSARLPDYGSGFELTADRFAAVHRYRFDRGSGRLRIDCNQVGMRWEYLAGEKLKYGVTNWSEKLEAVSLSERAGSGSCRAWDGTLKTNGIDLHFAIRVKGEIDDVSCSEGVIDFAGADTGIETAIGFSLQSVDEAGDRADGALAKGFDGVRAEAADSWRQALGRVRARFAKEQDARLFYSALYQSMVKPCDTGHGYTDFATFWDIYKTELPLILSLDAKTGRGIVEHIMSRTERQGFSPICQIMDDAVVHKDMQATALPLFTLCDAYFRGVLTRADYARVKGVFEKELAHADISGMSPTHALDLAGACGAAAFVAEACGDGEYAASLRRKSAVWKTAYDAKSGLLVENATYYEGNHWNYAFRPHPGMNDRVALAGGPEGLVKLLDRFFCFGCEPADWNPAQDRVQRVDHFEGLNNESDMDSPYAYIWAGRIDRTAEVVDLVRRCRFTTGEGGCPGNNDSGATGSWYVWNALGLYPLTGTPYSLIVTPFVEAATVELGRGCLEIVVERESVRSIYPVGYEFNGRSFREPWLKVAELEAGGRLVIRLADRPAEGLSPIPDFL